MALPENFIWGTSTAAYQIEGAWDKDGREPSVWDTFSQTPGKILNNDNGNVACDHYNRLGEDLEIIAGAAPNYRFSFSWTRLFQNGNGSRNQKGADFYNRLIDGLLERGVTPWATMFHWDYPQILQDRGGWTNRDSMEWFGEYASGLMDLFGDRISNWMIFNEPNVHAWFGHGNGIHAPGLKDKESFLKATHNINRAIGHAYRVTKAARPEHNIGSTYQTVCIRPSTPETSAYAVEMMDAIWNRNALDPLFKGIYPSIIADDFAPFIKDGDMEIIKNDLDFIGVQHYNPIYFTDNPDWIYNVFFGPVPEHLPVTGYGWPIEPEGFREILMRLHNEYGHKNLVVTESGAAYLDEIDADGGCRDPERIDYLQKHIAVVEDVRKQGVPVTGYFAWSLFDNFEWADGYKYRFGLVHVDYGNGTRTIKDSYRWFGDVVKGNGLKKAA
ncbi:MAG: GH1 family beta-glucosidase [Micavibrio sp.]